MFEKIDYGVQKIPFFFAEFLVHTGANAFGTFDHANAIATTTLN
jgi:hypothetical protein